MDEIRGFQGVWIPAGIWNHPELSWMEKCLVAEIDSLSSAEHGPCHASCEFLAQRMKSGSVNAMQKMLSDLTKKGFLWQLGFDGRIAWRCVAMEFSCNQSKYREWAKDPKLSLPAQCCPESGLTPALSCGSVQTLPPAQPEIPVEIPVERESVSFHSSKKQSDVCSKARPKDEQEVIDYCSSVGLPKERGSYFFNHWLANGFMIGKNQIKDWRAVIRSWKSNGYTQVQTVNGNKTRHVELVQRDALGRPVRHG